MGRASKNRGPIGHYNGQGNCLPDSPGQRKAPCSLAPWQLQPKVSPAGDLPTRPTHQRKGASCCTAVAIRARLQELSEAIHGVRPARQPHHTAPVLVRRGDGPYGGQLETLSPPQAEDRQARRDKHSLLHVVK